ncbi:MAG: dihydrofolate reductase family protein [Bacteroidales bacterium]|nr:dihydrofolate reductase family protein [Bacteroidales bacterium]
MDPITGLKNTRIANLDIKEEVLALKQSVSGDDKDILVGSPGLIVSLMNLKLINEIQLCVHPVIAVKGLPLFKNINDKTILKLLKIKNFKGGAVIFFYSVTG